MADSLILEHLKHIRAAVDRLTTDIADINTRLTNLEHGQANALQQDAHQTAMLGQIQHLMDRHGGRLDRIERRLELVD